MDDDKKKIAMNLQPLAADNLTGIGYYAANVARGLISDYPESELHVFDFRGKNGGTLKAVSHLAPQKPESSRVRTVTSIPLSVYIRMKSLGGLCPYEKLTRSEADLTLFFNYLAPAGVRGKRIITIYDMVCERYPQTMQARNRRLLKSNLSYSAHHADAIVTISEFSKKEIHTLLGVPEEKIFVAPCGTDTAFYKPFADDKEAGEGAVKLFADYGIMRYLLYVGTLEPRKNLKTVIAAFDKIAEEFPDVKLVLAGGVGWQPEETIAAIEGSRAARRIVRTGYVSDETKRLLYRCAEGFVFPSLYEGFGMPVTEAMACGTQCIAAGSSSLPEVAGGLTQMVAPLDVDGFAAAMRNLLSGEISYDKEQLTAHARKFTWDRAVQGFRDAIDFV